jgi:hypothetical protein
LFGSKELTTENREPRKRKTILNHKKKKIKKKKRWECMFKFGFNSSVSIET